MRRGARHGSCIFSCLIYFQYVSSISKNDNSENTKQAIDTISNELQHIADLSSQIAAAAEQQQCTSAEIARNMNNINGIADENRTALDQVGHTSEQLQQLSREQQALVHKFTL